MERKKRKKLRINFVYTICKDINADAMKYWVEENEGFSRRIRSLMRKGVFIKKKHILQAMLAVTKKANAADDEGFDWRRARSALKHLAKEFSATDRIPDRALRLPPGYEDMEYILSLLTPMPFPLRRELCGCTKVLKRIRKTGKANDLEGVFEAFRAFFYQLAQSGARFDEKRRADFSRFRNIMTWFSEYYHGDPLWWYNDYAAYDKK